MNTTLKLFICFLLSDISFSQVDLDSNYKDIFPYQYIPDGCIKLKEDSLEFDGYLIFEINRTKEKYIQSNDSNFYICRSYWVDRLEYLGNSKFYKYYNIAWRFYEDVAFKEDQCALNDTLSDSYKFKIFYNAFYNKLRDSVYHPFLSNSLTTKIFLDTDVVFYTHTEKSNIGYFIFRNTFNGILLEYESYQKTIEKSNKQKSKERKFLLPISEVFLLKSIDVDEAKNYQFIKSRWFPKHLLKVK